MLPLLPLLFLLAPLLTTAQTTTPDGCLRLSGSVACPGFSSAYLHPSNLSNAFPFFSGVSSVASFDAGALNYFSDPNAYRTTQFINKLGCSNSSQATLRYSRTVLCSMWVNEKWSINCFDLYNATNAATGPKMVCQSTCQQYATSENDIVASSTYCPGPDLTGGGRQGNITKDFVQCTNWATLATNNTATCIQGDDNEGNCGYASSTAQLCQYCSGSSPDACCRRSNTDLTSCGYVLPAIVNTTTSTSATMSASSTAAATSSAVAAAAAGGRTLSGGAIAGIVVGSVVGGLLLLGLLVFLLLFCGVCGSRKKNRSSKTSSFLASPNPPLPPAQNSTFTSPTPSGPQMSDAGHNASLSGMLAGAGRSERTMVPSSSSVAGSSGKLGKYAGVGAGVGAGVVAGRALLGSVRDENQSGEHLILTNSTVSVLWPYTAALPDELTLRPGMKLTVLRIYDDAWGTGQVSEGEDDERGKQGAFPLVCVTQEREGSTADGSPRSRNSVGSGSVRWSSSHEGTGQA